MTLDQTLSSQLQGNVYAMIAELELKFGQPEKAITAASRGLRRAEDQDVLGRTVITLARAYLLNEDPFSANKILFEFSDELRSHQHQRLASVFSSFARYKSIGPTHGLQNEGERLMMALAAFAAERRQLVCGFIDRFKCLCPGWITNQSDREPPHGARNSATRFLGGSDSIRTCKAALRSITV